MKKNKFTSYLLILLVCLLLEVFTSSNIKAATYQVNNFASLKSTIESAPSGTHDVEVTADFDFTGPAITIPANVSINLHSDSTRHTLRRVNTYLLVFFNITNANSSMNVTNLIIDGQKDMISSNPTGVLFNLGTDNTRVLTLGKDLIVYNHKKTGNGMIVTNNGGILEIKDNAEFYNNDQMNNTNGLFYANNINSITNISDNVKIHDNKYLGTSNTSYGLILYNAGIVNISDNVKIYDNSCLLAGATIIYNTNSGNINFSDNVIFSNNSTMDSSLLSTGPLIGNTGSIYAKDNVKFNNNKGYYGVFGLNYNSTGGTLLNLLDLRDNVEIYNNNAEVAGAIIIGQATTTTYPLTPHELHISGNVKIHDNKANVRSGAIHVQGSTTDVLIEGTTKIFNNQAEYYPGAVYNTTGSRVVIKDEVTIFSNIAKTYGGGIVTTASNGSLIIDGNVKIYDNKAPSGGGLYLEGNNTIGGNTEIYNNEASGDASNINNHGGGIYLNNAANKTVIKDSVKIHDNKTTNDNTPNNDGGGIYINASVSTPVQIVDNVIITNNEAVRDGGGIFTQEYEDLIVGKDVLFNNNKAIVGYNENLPVIDPTNYAIYQTNVLVPNNKWTTNRTYGYNNYDINYAGAHEAFILSYDANGGSGTIPSDQAIAGGDNVNVDFSKLPSKGGYVFLGWSTNANDTSPMYTSTGVNTLMMPSNNLTLYAIYAPTFLIDTDVIGGDIDKPAVVINGDNIRIHFKGHKGYKLKKIIIDGKEIDISTITGDYYEFLNVTSKHRIKVIFEKEAKDDNKEINTGKDNKKIPPGGNEYLSYLGVLLSIMSILGTGIYYHKK